MILSIIIAVYNGERTIARAIESVLNASLEKKQYEIIVINDGSTDGTVRVVEELIKHNSNIFLINKDNGGQSTARNIGFKLAKGEYIFCLDADDYLESELLLPTLELVKEKKCDIVSISFRVKKNLDANSLKIIKYPKFDSLSIGSFLSKNVIVGSMAFYFYKTSIIRDNKLTLIEGIFHEDEEFILRYMSHCSSIFVSNIPLYNYIIHENSTVHKMDLTHRLKLFNNLLVVLSSLKNRLEELTDDEMITGFQNKVTQLQLSVFIRFFKDRVYKVFALSDLFILLEKDNLYPIKYCSMIKYNIYSYFMNKKCLLKLYNRILTLYK